MSNTNESQDKSVFLKTRVPEKLMTDFRLALALRDETLQDAIQNAIEEYVKNTKVPREVLEKFAES